MTHGSLFSGIGGFDLAAEWMGWENMFHCEIAKYQRTLLTKRFPKSISIKDVRDIYRYSHEYNDLYSDGELFWCERHDKDFSDCDCIGCSQWDDEIGKVDILTAGFPCQPFSNNGKRQGEKDERNLWPETIRVVRSIKPRWFVGENVPGIITWNNGKYLSNIVVDLKNEGYQVWPINIPALSVGAEHKRERIWIVAYNSSQRIQGVRPNFQQKSQPLGNPLLPLRNSYGQWEVEPDFCRTDDGIPRRVDRLMSLGNAIVPQVAFQIFKAIQEFENQLT